MSNPPHSGPAWTRNPKSSPKKHTHRTHPYLADPASSSSSLSLPLASTSSLTLASSSSHSSQQPGAPYLTHIHRHHGQLTLVAPDNLGARRQAGTLDPPETRVDARGGFGIPGLVEGEQDDEEEPGRKGKNKVKKKKKKKDLDEQVERDIQHAVRNAGRTPSPNASLAAGAAQNGGLSSPSGSGERPVIDRTRSEQSLLEVPGQRVAEQRERRRSRSRTRARRADDISRAAGALPNVVTFLRSPADSFAVVSSSRPSQIHSRPSSAPTLPSDPPEPSRPSQPRAVPPSHRRSLSPSLSLSLSLDPPPPLDDAALDAQLSLGLLDPSDLLMSPPPAYVPPLRGPSSASDGAEPPHLSLGAADPALALAHDLSPTASTVGPDNDNDDDEEADPSDSESSPPDPLVLAWEADRLTGRYTLDERIARDLERRRAAESAEEPPAGEGDGGGEAEREDDLTEIRQAELAHDPRRLSRALSRHASRSIRREGRHGPERRRRRASASVETVAEDEGEQQHGGEGVAEPRASTSTPSVESTSASLERRPLPPPPASTEAMSEPVAPVPTGAEQEEEEIGDDDYQLAQLARSVTISGHRLAAAAAERRLAAERAAREHGELEAVVEKEEAAAQPQEQSPSSSTASSSTVAPLSIPRSAPLPQLVPLQPEPASSVPAPLARRLPNPSSPDLKPTPPPVPPKRLIGRRSLDVEQSQATAAVVASGSRRRPPPPPPPAAQVARRVSLRSGASPVLEQRQAPHSDPLPTAGGTSTTFSTAASPFSPPLHLPGSSAPRPEPPQPPPLGLSSPQPRSRRPRPLPIPPQPLRQDRIDAFTALRAAQGAWGPPAPSASVPVAAAAAASAPSLAEMEQMAARPMLRESLSSSSSMSSTADVHGPSLPRSPPGLPGEPVQGLPQDRLEDVLSAYTDLDLLLARLEGQERTDPEGAGGEAAVRGEGAQGQGGANYDDLLTLADLLGAVAPAGASPSELAEHLTVARVELERRRVDKRGKVKTKLSVVGVRCVDCPICMSRFKVDDFAVVLPSCLHIFHEKCIRSWFHRSRVCPVCRGQVFPARPPQLVDVSSS
ncbi:hypothetical protein JCM21900_000947 [Sporobolomyces salmonicolor]